MDGLFGLGLAFALIIGLVFIVPAVFILTIAFVYVRQQRGQPVDIHTGVSAYTVILIGLGALLITLGVARLLTAIMAEIDGDYTYGTANLFNEDIFGDGFDDDFAGSQGGSDSSAVDNRQEDDVAQGLALFVAGAIAVALHIWLRGWLAGGARFDRGVEGAWDTLFALLIGLAAVAIVADMLSDTFTRAITDDDTSAAGQTIAEMIALLALWAVYGYRALSHAGLARRPVEGGPRGGAEL